MPRALRQLAGAQLLALGELVDLLGAVEGRAAREVEGSIVKAAILLVGMLRRSGYLPGAERAPLEWDGDAGE